MSEKTRIARLRRRIKDRLLPSSDKPDKWRPTTEVELPPESDRRTKKKYYIQMTFVRRCVTALLRLLFSLIAKMRVVNLEKFPDHGPVVVAANHLTNFDVLPLQFALPRPIYYMGKEELFRNPILDWVLRQLGAFPVYRGAHDAWAIQHAQEILHQGQVLGIFPEGTRSMGEGLRTAKTGAARLALTGGSPLVPIAIYGTHQMLRKFPIRTEVTITICDPIVPRDDETALGLTDRYMFALAEILPYELRGVYKIHPPGF